MKIKKLLVLVSMLAVMFSLAGCGETYDKPFEYDEKSIAVHAIDSFMKYENISDEYVEYYLNSGTEFEKSAVKGISQAKETDKVGEYDDYSDMINQLYAGVISLEDADIEIENNKDYVNVIFYNHAENRDVKITVKYIENPDYFIELDKSLASYGLSTYEEFYAVLQSEAEYNNMSVQEYCESMGIASVQEYYDITVDYLGSMLSNDDLYPFKAVEMVVAAEYSKKELVGQAGMNTLIGMGTVFIVLIFISFIISLFKYLPALFAKKPKVEPAKAEAPKTTTAPVAANNTENLTDDAQLVAVITAAIYAYEAQAGNGAVSKDKLVVRSIKRVRK